MRRRIIVTAITYLTVATILGACSSNVGESQLSGESRGEQSTSSAQDTPNFSGPWAQEFAEFYQSIHSELAKRILAKGSITESDLAETQEANRVCLESQGFTNVEHFTGGGMSLTPPTELSNSEVDIEVEKCSEDSGLTPVETLYAGMSTNPNNENMDELIVQCLKDDGIVEQSFTIEDLNSWYKNGDPMVAGAGAAVGCATDPLGLL